MFSGLIEATGVVIGRQRIPAGARLSIGTTLARDLAPGDSIAVSGVCLTVVEQGDASFDAEISPETARVTTLGGLSAGTLVNLERPLRVDGRLGGHFVLGHVDTVGHIRQVRSEEEFNLVTVDYDPTLTSMLVPKGSIAVDGISLTVAAIRPAEFDVQIVPYTWRHTNLASAGPDTPVNLECDIIGKYVVRAVRETA
jgi:riboflavin synthase